MISRFSKLAATASALALLASAGPAAAGVLSSTTTTLFSTTTTVFSTTTTTFPITQGACCFGEGQCTVTDAELCTIEMQGSYAGDNTSCSTPGICTVGSTTTTIPGSTTTTIPPSTTTTVIDTTTTTMPPMGACCVGSSCYQTTFGGCLENQGGWNEGLTCEDPGVCVNCGNGCLEYGEQCDDGGTAGGDGCDSGCAAENCYQCNVIGCVANEGDAQLSTVCALAPTGLINPYCATPPVCQFTPGPGCNTCGDGNLELGEDCDDGNTANGDCCSANCSYEAPGAACADGIFCNGTETCDGKGTCLPAEVAADCSFLDGQCGSGVCDTKADACVLQPVADGTACEVSGDCIVEGSGTCQDGSCVGAGTTLSPTCRWIILGGTPGGTVKVRTGEFSTVDADTCGDIGRSGGITSGNFVVVSTMGEGIRFDASADVQGDIVTGGSSLATNLYAKIPGTGLASVPGGTVEMKDPVGTVADTTGNHQLVQVCDDDQDLMNAAIPALDGKVSTGDKGYYRLKIGASDTFDVSGAPNLSVLDFATFRLGRRSTLTLKGGPADVLMLRVNGGRMNVSTGARIVLDGLKPENVLFYVKGQACRISHSVEGAGTVFCSQAGKYRIGVGAKWTGTFLGGTREIRARFRAELTHAPFTGF